MKTFEGKNFYEILNLPPNADMHEIRQAHAEALEMYGESALATYALFSEEERKKLLRIIDQAFQTLRNKKKRAEYNLMLVTTGQIDAAIFSEKPRNRASERQSIPSLFDAGEPKDGTQKQETRERISQLTDEIYEKSLISGKDLKTLREALAIDIPEIYQKTRISRTTIERIEQDQYEDLPAEIYLISFLKSYAEILRIEPKHIVDGYLKQKANAETK